MIVMMKTIDVHTHGIGGYDTQTTISDNILRIADIHGSHGVSEIVLSIYPAEIALMRRHMDAVKEAIEKSRGGSDQPSHDATRASIIGVHLEGPFLNPEKSGALDKGTFIEPAEYHFKKLIEGFEGIVKIITIAPEMNRAPQLIKKISGRGIIVNMGHSNATYNDAEAGYRAGARGITHIFNAMRAFHHREPGLAGFGLLNNDVYIEVIADPYHLDEKTLEFIFRIKNPERILIVSDTVKEAKTTPGAKAITGVHEKLSGGCLTITEASRRLIEMGFDPPVVENCISENPERYLSDQ